MNFVRRLFSFRGRIDRTQYLLSMLAAGAIPLTAAIIVNVAGFEAAVVEGGIVLHLLPIIVVLFWMMFAAMAKRFHDVNWSGFACLLIFVPFVGVLAPIVLLFWPGTTGDNAYGAPPSLNPFA